MSEGTPDITESQSPPVPVPLTYQRWYPGYQPTWSDPADNLAYGVYGPHFPSIMHQLGAAMNTDMMPRQTFSNWAVNPWDIYKNLPRQTQWMNNYSPFIAGQDAKGNNYNPFHQGSGFRSMTAPMMQDPTRYSWGWDLGSGPDADPFTYFSNPFLHNQGPRAPQYYQPNYGLYNSPYQQGVRYYQPNYWAPPQNGMDVFGNPAPGAPGLVGRGQPRNWGEPFNI